MPETLPELQKEFFSQQTSSTGALNDVAKRYYEEALAGALPGQGTVERGQFSSITTLPLTGAEQQVVFTTSADAAGVSLNPSSSLTFNVEGHYSGTLSLHIDKSGGVHEVAVWVERKPLSTGVWELASGGMAKTATTADGGNLAPIGGSFNVDVGDELRFMVKQLTGTGSLTAASETVSLGTVTQAAASVDFHKVGQKS